MNKQKLRILLAKGELEKTLQHLLKQCEQVGEQDLHTTAVLLCSDYKSYEQAQMRTTLSASELRIQHNQILVGALGLIDDFPTPAPDTTPQKGMPEYRFKQWLLGLLAAGKIGLFAWVTFTWRTGGFSKAEFFATLGFLLPIFVAYLSVMLNEYLRQRDKAFIAKRIMPRPLVILSFVLLPLYVFLFVVGINWRAKGILLFEEMNTWLTLTESCLGVYVGTIIFELFKAGKDD